MEVTYSSLHAVDGLESLLLNLVVVIRGASRVTITLFKSKSVTWPWLMLDAGSFDDNLAVGRSAKLWFGYVFNLSV